ncbi:MAG: transcription antitermination factor NusB [Deltaproteobacteria bacterium]|nr:transcription antitermination factor NusB [Deltaproteobacteria bacterium]
MVGRRKARELALQILYEVDLSKQSLPDVLSSFADHFHSRRALDEFTTRIVRGVTAHRDEIDRCLKECSENWTLGRMSAVDRNILRMAVFEILWCADIPRPVSINEAIELGKKFGNEKSAPFINGVLDKIGHSG